MASLATEEPTVWYRPSPRLFDRLLRDPRLFLELRLLRLFERLPRLVPRLNMPEDPEPVLKSEIPVKPEVPELNPITDFLLATERLLLPRLLREPRLPRLFDPLLLLLLLRPPGPSSPMPRVNLDPLVIPETPEARVLYPDENPLPVE